MNRICFSLLVFTASLLAPIFAVYPAAIPLAAFASENNGIIELSTSEQRRVVNLAANMSNRMEATIARLSKIADRIERRSEKLAVSGFSTTDSEQSLTVVRAELAVATSLLSNIDEVVYNFTTSEEPRAAWEPVRAQYQDAARALGSALAGLRTSYRALQNPVNFEPETTPTTSTTSSSI